MPSYLSPGVYVEEVESGSRPIEGVGTSVAAFIGFAQKGPFNEPTLITNWTQFTTVFGDFVEGTYLASSIYGFFANGGGICYVVRIGDAEEAEPGGERAGTAKEVASGPSAQLGPYVVRTLPGVTGEITVEVADPEGDDPPQDVFALVVKRDGVVAETYPAVTTKRSKENVATQVRARSQLIRLEEPGKGAAPARPESQVVTLAASPGAGPGAGAAVVPDALSADSYVGDPASGPDSAVWRRSRRSPWWPRRT
ncbi:Tail protein OS=Streptomyces antimycoticus OX=68175 GN=SSPO_013010 PE=3 SV=1 [Streptomyces antimycoticus]